MATILVVDDRPTNRQFLMTLLGYSGHRLLEARDGAEALEQAQRERPDLVITDILMPTMDGYEFTQRLRADPQLAATPVIFYTATYRTPEARRLAQECGVTEVLAKPAEVQEILEAVNRTLGVPAAISPPPPAASQEVAYLKETSDSFSSYMAEVQASNQQLARLLEHGIGLAGERDRLKQVAARLAAALPKLQRDSLRLTALMELGFDLLSERDPLRLCQMLCDAARRIVDSRYTVVVLLKEDERTLNHFFCSGPQEPRIDRPPLGQGVLSRLLRERQPLRLSTAAAAELGLPPEHPPCPFLGLPISTPLQVYGLLYFVDSCGTEGFGEEEEWTALTLAAEAAVLYENAHLYDHLQRHAAKLQVAVTQRHKAEEAARQAEERLGYIVAANPAVIYSLKVEGDRLLPTWVSENLAQMTGWTPEQALVPAWWFDCLHPEDKERAAAESAGVLAQNHVVHEYRFRCKDEKHIWVRDEMRLLRDPAAGPAEVMGAWIDITARKRHEEQQQVVQRVREQVWKMRGADGIQQVLEVLREGLEGQGLALGVDTCGINLIESPADPAVVRYHLLSPEGEWTGSDSGEASQTVLRFWRGGKPVYREDLEAQDPYGERERLRRDFPEVRCVVDVPFSHGTLALNSERPHAFSEQDIAFLQELAAVLSEGFRRLDDLRTLATTEVQLHQAQKLEAVGRLAGGVAHDFNNLLTVVAGYSEFLLRRLGTDHPHHAGLQEIHKAADRGAGLVRQLLAFSRKQVLDPRVLDLDTVVREVETMLSRLIGEDVELLTRLAPDLGQVKADPGQVEQVLVNLVVNARDAMPEGGTVVIETRNVDLDEGYAARHVAVEPGAYVLLSVSDSGVGMDAQTQAQIFEPFFTTKEPGRGTGLGLATVYGIVKQSGGYIWVYSEPGRGATFKIYLPRVREAAEPVSRKEVVQAGRGTETVLLVEDEIPLRELTALLLREEGYTVLEAGQGEEALQVSALHPGAIHLLVTDMVMPGMAGSALAEQMAALRPQLRVVYMSGYSEGVVAEQWELAPGTVFVQKPFSSSALLHKVREALNG